MNQLCPSLCCSIHHRLWSNICRKVHISVCCICSMLPYLKCISVFPCEHLQHMCCQSDEVVFLICCCFISLHVFSQMCTELFQLRTTDSKNNCQNTPVGSRALEMSALGAKVGSHEGEKLFKSQCVQKWRMISSEWIWKNIQFSSITNLMFCF